MSPPPAFQLFTSLRYDPLLLSSVENSRPDLNFVTPSPFYMLAYHRDRMVEAAQHFDFDLVTKRLADGKRLHEDLLWSVKAWQKSEGKQDGPLKLRVLFDKAANMTVDFLSIPPVPLTTLYPTSFDPPNPTPQEHPTKKKDFQPSPLTGGALNLGPTDSLPAGDSSQGPQPPQPKEFKPSPLTGGALILGPTDSLPAGNKDPSSTPPPPEWKLRLDTAPTPSSPYTLLKTTERTAYDQSRARALPENKESSVHREVILFNTVREATEGTLTSLYFFRGGRWVTPPVGVPSAFTASGASSGEADDGNRHGDANADEGELRKPFAGRWGHSLRSAKVGAGGQRGTSRRWALGKGYCMEETVELGTIEVGEGVWLSNGVRGFGFGRVVA
ncbi:Aminodeoxychorismate lyase [Ascochyta rabiei]|uniref:Catalytic n=1 Tax=Didymella rabiei TaxID=5454 RepID=A0A162WH55_DIDRA|nr:Aminodeoxychorismate lyase [Ascochyta rabiei]KZM19024.1 catalytic [Ascochyta rabiei]UPX20097.1 Aminodeoxychorismate lyase [Ascochyta rabiei]